MRAAEVRDAPLSLVRSNFDYWPTPTTIEIQSNRYIAPLFMRDTHLSEGREQQLQLLYINGAVILFVMTLGILMIWLGFLRPTVRKLSDARADTQFILDYAPGYICSYNPDGNVVSANQGYAELVDVSSVAELKGLHISDFLADEVLQQVQDPFKLAAKGEFQRFDIKRNIQGTERVLSVSYRPKMTSDGTVSAVVALVVDITDRYTAESALRLSEENLRITLDSIGDAVIATNINLKIVKMNPQACHLTGWQELDAIGKDLGDVYKVVNTQTKKEFSDLLEYVLKREQKTNRQSDAMLVSKNGDEYLIADKGAPIRDSDGETLGLVLVFRDMTEEYQLNQRVAQSEKLQSIGQLAGGIAHDFNNLLAGVQGAIDMIQVSQPGNPTTNPEVGLFEQINRLIRRGAGLTEQLTLFARVKESTFKPVDVKTLIEDGLAMMRSTSDRRIRFEFEDHANHTIVFGSDSTLQTAILNILLNAVDAISDKGVVRVVISNTDGNQEVPKITQDGMEHKQYLSICISDTGSGISENNLSRIFDPFFTTKELGNGTGLGLAAAYGTVHDTKGTISVNSEKNKGTEFEILLPCFDNVDLGDESKTAKLIKFPVPIKKMCTVLYADDEDMLRFTIQGYLQRINYRVLLAKNGQECINMVKKHKDEIDILLLDMNMPLKNGAQVIDEIDKIDEMTKKIPIIVSTGYSSEQNQVNPNDKRIYKVLEKPYSLHDLARILDTITKNQPTGDTDKQCINID